MQCRSTNCTESLLGDDLFKSYRQCHEYQYAIFSMKSFMCGSSMQSILLHIVKKLPYLWSGNSVHALVAPSTTKKRIFDVVSCKTQVLVQSKWYWHPERHGLKAGQDAGLGQWSIVVWTAGLDKWTRQAGKGI